MTVETIAAFLTASILLGLAPGPDYIFVLTQSALHGRRAGMFVMLGLCTGLIFHTLAVAMGVAVIFQTSAAAFNALKLIGAAYLVYLAWMAFKSKGEKIETAGGGEVNIGRLYRRGIIMNITNPKVSIFFLAFLPQFADPSKGAMSLQLILLGGLFIFTTIIVFGTIAYLAGTLGKALSRSNGIQKILNRVAGTVFLGLALKLAFTER